MPKAEPIMNAAEARRAAIDAMQCTIIADGLVRLGKSPLKYLKDSRCFIDIWSPNHTVRHNQLIPMRFYFSGSVMVMGWCDANGNALAVDNDTPLYVTVRYAGRKNYSFATQCGHAVEKMLANRNYNLLDYRQYNALSAITNRKGKK